MVIALVVVVQGFGVFGSFDQNPSEKIVRDLEDSWHPEGFSLVTTVLKTAAAAVESIPALMTEWRPDIWIGVGLAGGRHAVAIERVALNVQDYRLPDQDGLIREDVPCVPEGPAAYFSTLPLQAILARWRQDDVPGYLSNTAGTYLCNQSFYVARHAAETMTSAKPWVGFVHIPLMVEQSQNPGRTPALPYALLKTAVVGAVEEAVKARVGCPV